MTIEELLQRIVADELVLTIFYGPPKHIWQGQFRVGLEKKAAGTEVKINSEKKDPQEALQEVWDKWDALVRGGAPEMRPLELTAQAVLPPDSAIDPDDIPF